MAEYVCQFCNKPHTNVEDYAKCVSSCYAEMKRKEREVEAAKIEQQRVDQAKKAREAREKRETSKAILIKEIQEKENEVEKLTAKLHSEYPETRGYDLFGLQQLFDSLSSRYSSGNPWFL